MQELLDAYAEADIPDRQPVTFAEVERIWAETVSPV